MKRYIEIIDKKLEVGLEYDFTRYEKSGMYEINGHIYYANLIENMVYFLGVLDKRITIEKEVSTSGTINEGFVLKLSEVLTRKQ